MKIAINAQQLLEKHPAGPELFTTNLIKALTKIDRTNDYVLYLPEGDTTNVPQLLAANFHYKTIKKIFSWTHISLALQIFKDKPDVYYAAVHTLPVLRRPQTKYVTMIHGLEYQYFKKPFQALPLWFATKFSDLLIVPSQATKEALINKWHVSAKKIEVVPEGVGEQYVKSSSEQILKAKQKYNINTDNYLIFISTIQPRKNIPNMVEGFAQALHNKAIPIGTQLLIIGKKGWEYQQSYAAPQKTGIETSVRFFGRLDEADVIPLLSGAKLYINLSLQEGFGLPLLEAMKCQVPCLVSDIPAFKETGQDLVNYTNPVDVAKIARDIEDSLNNYDIEKIRRAHERARQFTWEKTAYQTLNLFK